jgi:hypothetical protein
MNTSGERDLLLMLIEQTSKEWEENYRPEDVRLSAEKINLLLSIRALVADRGSDIDIALLRDRCPTFVSVYRAVLLRDLEELAPNGTTDEGRDPGRG